MSDARSARLTESGSRGRGTRGPVPSRDNSTRSSAIYSDDFYMPVPSQTYGYGHGSQGLRSTASRYSLNEQFAATRQDFEFGFDDGASTFERSTIASEALGELPEQEEKDGAVLSPIADYYDPFSALQGRERVLNPHDLLVLPPNPSPRDVRRAYYRLFVLLYPDAHPPKLRKAASVYFTLVQGAFEQLIGSAEQKVHDWDEINTFDLVLDEPGRYQVYQLWRVPLGRLARGGSDRVSPTEAGSQWWNCVRKRLDEITIVPDRFQNHIRNTSLGFGVKLDMGSPHLFETGAFGFSRFSVLDSQFLSLVPIRVAPRLELAYTLPPLLSHERGSWTLSTAAEPRSLGASLKYGIDIENPQWLTFSHGKTTTLGKKTDNHSTGYGLGIRVEVELSSGWLWSKFLALRCLKRIGRFSRLGVEFGLGTYHLHLSLYWSRLGQRVRLPLLLNFGSMINSRLLFWAAVVPFAGLAAWDVVSRRQRLRAHKLQQCNESLLLVQDLRAEADDVTILLSANVGSKQATERANRGLVILSAKYGVKKDDSWGLEEVADVTIAVAALVDNGQLRMPGNVNKNNVLGFWDPVPGLLKTLHVRYLYQGKEKTIEVVEHEELILPPS